MKLSKILLLISTTVSMFFISACGEHVQKYQPIYNENGDIMMQFSEQTFKDKEYKDILEDMKDMGFKNFKINFNGSLLLGIINHENEIYTSYVNDKLDFIENSYVPKESVVYLEIYSKEKKSQYIRTAIDGKVPAMFGPNEFNNKNRTNTINELRLAGISNYELVPIYDCSSSDSISFDMVEKIEINQSSNFSWYTFVDQNAKYSIYYHDVKSNEPSGGGSEGDNKTQDDLNTWYNHDYLMNDNVGSSGSIRLTVESFNFTKNQIALHCSFIQFEIDSIDVKFSNTTADVYYDDVDGKLVNKKASVTKPSNFSSPYGIKTNFDVLISPSNLTGLYGLREINYYFKIAGYVDGVYGSEEAEIYPQFTYTPKEAQ